MRRNPDTSISAYHSVSKEMKLTHYKKIIEALKVLGIANYEKIALFLCMTDRNMVSRRLKEMMPPDEDNPLGLNFVFKPGSKSTTTSGRMAYDYQLTGTQPKTDVEQNQFKKGITTSTDFANKLIKDMQPELFPSIPHS